ncbi:MAG: hypothetical protein M1826_000398 [Phylliscum demangeonii]|nr:MAG: hypothetical protein M1826_000398 [Phylliscum demangeonii]
MLRDWKLAQTTYDLVRPDFNNDKAWKYYAGANEMAAISTLLSSQVLTTKVRAETVDQMLDTASYSYISRCAAPYSALRCLALGAELLKGRGGSATDDAARWETRISEMRLLGPAAMWNILAANAWLDLGKFKQAQKCLNQASNIYNGLPREDGLLSFSGINAFVCLMIRGLKDRTAAGQDGKDLENTNVTGDNFVDEEREDFDHGSRRSMIGTGFVPRVDYDLESTNSPQGMEENDGSREEQSE